MSNTFNKDAIDKTLDEGTGLTNREILLKFLRKDVYSFDIEEVHRDLFKSEVELPELVKLIEELKTTGYIRQDVRIPTSISNAWCVTDVWIANKIAFTIDSTHKVANIGLYNRFVNECGQCDSRNNIDIFGKDCIGFGVPLARTALIANYLAVVYECPACFERQWGHTSEAGYRTYLGYLYLNDRKEKC